MAVTGGGTLTFCTQSHVLKYLLTLVTYKRAPSTGPVKIE